MDSRSPNPEVPAPRTATDLCTIVCAADERYAMPLGVMLESVKSHTQGPLDIYVIDCGLCDDSRRRIDSLASESMRLHWRPSTRAATLRDPFWGHVTGATYERLLLDDYLFGHDGRVLWLDADLLVLDDVTRLWRDSPAPAVVYAVRDPFVPQVSSTFGIRDWRRLGLDPETPYFNAGVMLVDLQRWRNENVAGRALSYLETYGRKVHFNEQEALNAAIGGAWNALDDRWNVSANRFHARRQNPGGGHAAILHFAGRVKPWGLPGLGEQQTRYFHFLDRTPWRGTRPQPTPFRRLLAWYLQSDLRRMTYWLENLQLRLRHLWGL